MKRPEKLEQVEETYKIPREKIISVGELNQYLSQKIVEDTKLRTVYVLGEVSNLFKSRNGHLFFTLKEEEASIRCIVYRSTTLQLDYVPEDGKEVLAIGSVRIYVAKAECQINVEKVLPVGEGLIYYQIKMLKEKLEKEGLFKPEYKKPIPLIPLTVGIVSSLDGAATRDMIRTLTTRFPNIQIEIVPVEVQGKHAPEAIIEAISILDQRSTAEVILLGRGGGSVEDLMAFNDEGVARAVFNANIPIITGIGHQTDITVCDIVADAYGITPTAAAKMAVIDQTEALKELENLRIEAENKIQKIRRLHAKEKEAAEERRKARIYKWTAIVLIIILIIIICLILFVRR